MRPPESPQIAILLCTFQGQAFLPAQLDSFAAQTRRDWALWVSDDGSSDGTRATLDHYRDLWAPRALTVVSGPGRGFSANFTALARRPDVQASYYAFSDQDDVWEADKLERATRWLAESPANVPAMYCSRTRLIDDAGRDIGMSALFSRPPSFANALAQNIAGGNTMVINDAARRRVVEAFDAGAAPVIYDWWIYLVVTACGGHVHYDPIPTVRYRQHGHNAIGANTRARDRASNAREALRGRHRRWNDTNLAALERIAPAITPANQRILENFRQARERRWLPAITTLYRSGVRRQTLASNAALFLAAATGRL